MDINILLDAPPHAYWKSAVLLVLDGYDFGVERMRIPADGGQCFQINVDTDSSATWTEFRRDGGQLLM